MIHLPSSLLTAFRRRSDHSEASPAKRPTILVVDDEPAVRKLVLRLLSTAGPELLEAEHGKDALDVIERHQAPIDLLVTDIKMPVMNGQTLVEILHLHHPTMKVLFLSGYSEVLFEHGGILPTWSAYLDKPITGDGLRQAVSLLLYDTTGAFKPQEPEPTGPVSRVDAESAA